MTSRTLKVLVVDDNRSAADALARLLRKRGEQVEAVYDGQSAISFLETETFDLVLTDLKMEPVDGLAVLAAARATRPPVEVIVFTAYGAVDIAVKAMRLGARDFLTKPVSVDQVARRLEGLRGGEPPLQGDGGFEFVAVAQSSRRLKEVLQRAAGAPAPVWIDGEIGSGRGHAALALHHYGSPELPFTIRDLGRDHVWPTQGTVLLPNVDDLPDDLQVKLHRDLHQLPKGVRPVATAGSDSTRRRAEGTLRPELYYALNVVAVSVPPLRDRVEDIEPLLNLTLDTLSRRYGRPRPRVDARQLKLLQRHFWPGNVRELLNLAERAVVMGSSAFDIDLVEIPSHGLPRLEPGFSLATYLESVEKRILEEALRKSGGDRAATARLLGLERNTLRYKLKKYTLLTR